MNILQCEELAVVGEGFTWNLHPGTLISSKERTADTITTFFALAAIRLILARATDRVAGPAHRRVVEDRGCRVAGPASRAEAAAGSRYLVLVDKLSQSLQDRCLLLLSLAALATSSMQ